MNPTTSIETAPPPESAPELLNLLLTPSQNYKCQAALRHAMRALPGQASRKVPLCGCEVFVMVRNGLICNECGAQVESGNEPPVRAVVRQEAQS